MEKELMDTAYETLKNRNEAYMDAVNSVNLGASQEAVFRVIFHNPDSTDQEISDYANIPLSVVNARRNELHQEGLIFPSGHKPSPDTGKNRTTWRVRIDGSVPKVEVKHYLTNTDMKNAERILQKLNSFGDMSEQAKFQRNKLLEILNG